MPALFWTSLALGAVLGAANAAASLALQRRAEGRTLAAFTQFVLGGMMVRMLVVLGLAAAVLVWMPVHVGAFVGGLFVVFVAGTAFDIARIRRAVDAPTSL